MAVTTSGRASSGHRGSGGEEGARIDGAVGGGGGQEAQEALREDQQGEQREHDVGTPAIISTADSTARASHVGRPYSDSHTASATPRGPASAIPTAATISVPSIGSRKPPLLDCWISGAGEVTSIAGFR